MASLSQTSNIFRRVYPKKIAAPARGQGWTVAAWSDLQDANYGAVPVHSHQTSGMMAASPQILRDALANPRQSRAIR